MGSIRRTTDQLGLGIYACPGCEGEVWTIPPKPDLNIMEAYWVCTACGQRYVNVTGHASKIRRRKAKAAPDAWVRDPHRIVRW